MQVGDVVDGRYRILELLGEGAAGRVFRAEDRGRNRTLVALKLLHAKDPRWENLFRREFEVLSRLHHPNLVRVYDFGPAPDDNTWYFTQELVIGKPLLEGVSGKKVAEVLGIFIEICRALEFIHGHAVLHRDLKPANILLQKNARPGERARVLDFGLWRELDPTPQKGARWAGTPPYLASEVLRGYGHSISADLYALGVTLFQGITRKLPHGRGTPQELLVARKQSAPSLKERVEPRLAELIASLLDEVPENRPQNAAEVAAALSELAPGEAAALPLALGRARLVGRETEANALREIVQELAEKKGDATRFVLVEGGDGVGKSRLMLELKAAVQLDSGRSAIGRCTEDVRWSYRPIAELLRSLAPVWEDPGLSDNDRLVIARLCPDLARSAVLSTLPKQNLDGPHFHQLVADFFLRLADEQNCVLIIEDIPSADEATIAVLQSMLRRVDEKRLLIVATAGPLESYGPVPQELLEVAGKRMCRISVGPLASEDTQTLVAALLGVNPAQVPAAFLDAVEAHAKGNPLWIEELVALFIERGDLQRGASGWQLNDFDSAVVAPKQVAEVLSQRLRHLSDQDRRVLSALAVVGRPAGPKILSSIAGISVADARASLSQVESVGLIRVVGEDRGHSRVAFRHPQVRDALLEELQRGDVLHLWHETCAEMIEERARDRNQEPVLAETLAYHYERAQRLDDALGWWTDAASYALSSNNFEDAIRMSRHAARLCRQIEAAPGIAVELDLFTGKALLLAGRIPEARAFLGDAIAGADAHEAPEVFAALHLWLTRACDQMGEFELGHAAVEKGLSRLRRDQAPLAYGRLLLARGELKQRTDPISAMVDAEKALRIIPEPRLIRDELYAFRVLTVAAYWAGRRHRSIRYARHRIGLAEKAGDVLERITALRHLVVTLGETGQRLEARRHLNVALKLARQADFQVEEALLIKTLGEQLFVSGAYDEAVVRFQEAAKLSAQNGQHAHRGDALRMLGRCYALRGESERALEHLQAARAQLDVSGAPGHAASVRCQMALVYLAKGAVDEAEQLLREAADLLSPLKLIGPRAELLCAKGHLHTRKNDFSRGREAFLRSLALARKAEDQFAIAESLLGYGELLLRRNLPRRALRMARRAENIFYKMDAQGHLKRIQPLLNAAHGLSLPPQ